MFLRRGSVDGCCGDLLLSGKRGLSLPRRRSGGVEAALRREMCYHRSSKTLLRRMLHGVLVLRCCNEACNASLGLLVSLQAASPSKPPRRFVSGSTEFLEALINASHLLKKSAARPLCFCIQFVGLKTAQIGRASLLRSWARRQG